MGAYQWSGKKFADLSLFDPPDILSQTKQQKANAKWKNSTSHDSRQDIPHAVARFA